MLLGYAKAHCPSPFPNGIFKRRFSINSDFLSPSVHMFTAPGQMGLLCMWREVIYFKFAVFQVVYPMCMFSFVQLGCVSEHSPFEAEMEFSNCSTGKMPDFFL